MIILLLQLKLMSYTPKYFKVNPVLDTYLVKTRFFLLDLKHSVDNTIQTIEDEDFKLLPSWIKFHKYPLKAKGWYVHAIQGIFNGQHNLNELNADLVLNEANSIRNINDVSRRRVAMIFFGDNIRTVNLDSIGNITRQALPNWEIVVLHGRSTNQYKAEKKVKFLLEKLDREGFTDKPVLILSAKMGQRSFSIKEITELYLAYDGGSRGATIQKISRTLSPDYSNKDKIGNIFSLSFDSNRDDKVDAHVIQSALNIVDKHHVDFRTALQMILNSIDIFSSDQNGIHFINHDQFIEDTMKRGSVSRAMGVITNLYGLPKETLQAIAQGNADYKRDEILESVQKGKTTEGRRQGGVTEHAPRESSEELTLMNQARQVVITLIEEFGMIFELTEMTNCEDAIKFLEEKRKTDETWETGIFGQYGLTLDMIKFLVIESKRVRPEWIEAFHNKTISNIKK